MPEYLSDADVGLGRPRLLSDEDVGLGPRRKRDVRPVQDIASRQEELRAPRFVDQYGVTTALEVGIPMAAGAAGAPGGPATMIAAGALGSAAGRGAANVARDVEDYVRGIPVKRTMRSQAESMAEAGSTDLAFGTGIHGAGRAVSGILRFAGKATGLHSTDVSRAVREAAQGGIDVGAVDLNKPFYNLAAKVGGVMPVIGGPIRTAREVKAAQLSRGLSTALADVSPPIDLPRLGIQMSEAASNTLAARRAVAGGHYASMYETFDNLGNPSMVPTGPLKRAAAEILGEMEQLPRSQMSRTETGAVLGPDGRPISRQVTEQGPPVGFQPTESPGIAETLRAFSELPEHITPREMEALQKNLNRAARARSGNAMAANDFRIITDMNAATWEALDAIPAQGLPEGARERVLAAVKRAKGSWADLKSLEETAAAGPLRRADANFFRSGFEKIGSAEVDELANLYLSSSSVLRSPEYIDGLERLIGPENRKALARVVLHRAANPQEGIARALLDPQTGKPGRGVSDIVVFDAAAMRRKLGLSDPEGLLGGAAMRQNRQALSRLLDGSGLSVERLDYFLRTAERIQSSPTGDPSTFLTRRIVLGGAATVGAVGSAFAAGHSGPISIGAFLLTGRAFSKLISTPHGLRILREGMEPNLTRQQKLMLLQRVARAYPDEQVSMEGAPE